MPTCTQVWWMNAASIRSLSLGKLYYMLRRLEFGLNCACKIMKAVVSKVLLLDEE